MMISDTIEICQELYDYSKKFESRWFECPRSYLYRENDGKIFQMFQVMMEDAFVLHPDKTKEIVGDINQFIVSSEYRKDLHRHIRIDEALEAAQIRFDWEHALKSVRHGEDLSKKIGYAFSEEDIRNLAKLHKENKCRKKIEDLLTDCNFHKECSDFSAGRYDEYLCDDEVLNIMNTIDDSWLDEEDK
jgi:hypothetical protein